MGPALCVLLGTLEKGVSLGQEGEERAWRMPPGQAAGVPSQLPSPAALLAMCLCLTGPFLSSSCVCASVLTLPTPPPTSKQAARLWG